MKSSGGDLRVCHVCYQIIKSRRKHMVLLCMNTPEALRVLTPGAGHACSGPSSSSGAVLSWGGGEPRRGPAWDWRRPWPRDSVSVSPATSPRFLQTSEAAGPGSCLLAWAPPSLLAPEPSRKGRILNSAPHPLQPGVAGDTEVAQAAGALGWGRGRWKAPPPCL